MVSTICHMFTQFSFPVYRYSGFKIFNLKAHEKYLYQVEYSAYVDFILILFLQNLLISGVIQVSILFSHPFSEVIACIFNTVIFFFIIFINVRIQLPPFSHHHFPLSHTPPPPTLNLTYLWLCPWVLYTCSLTTFSLLSPLFPSPHSPGYCQFVLNFNVSGSILLARLFY